MASRLRRVPLSLALLLVVAAIEALAWIVVMPALQGPDEVGHFTYVQRVVERHTIPWRFHTSANPPGVSPYSNEVVTAELQGGLGPLAGNPAARPYWTKADYALWARTDKGLGADARTGGGWTSTLTNPPLYYLYDAVPYVAAYNGSLFDREMLMRLANIPLFLVGLVFVWLLAGELLGRGSVAQVVATAVAALVPQLLNVVATVNPDVMVITFWSAALYLLVLLLRRGFDVRLAGSLLVLAGLGGLTHPRSLPLFVPVAAAIAITYARQRGWRRLTAVRICALTFVAYLFALVAYVERGPKNHTREFISYLWQFYLPKLGFMRPSVGPSHYRFRQGMVDRIYGTLAQLEVTLPPGPERVVYWATLAGLLALVVTLVLKRRSLARNVDVVLVLSLAVVTLWLALHAGAYRGITALPFDPVFTGRYMLPLVALFGIAIALIGRALPRRIAGLYYGLVVGAGVVLQMESIKLLVARFYA